MNNFWTNVYGQIHTWWQTVGIFILGSVVTYLYNTATNDWSWGGIIAATLGALLTYGFTKRDHVKTDQVAKKAAVTREVPGKEQS